MASFAPDSLPPAALPRIPRAAHPLVIAALPAYAALLIVQLAFVSRLVAGREEMVQGSAAMAWHAWRAMNGESLYRDCLAEPPHVAAVYGPLAYLLPALVGLAVGASDPFTILLIGRGMSLLAAIISGVLIHALARRLGARRLFAWIAVLVALSNPIFWNLNAEFRADPVTLCLSMAAVACFADRDTLRRRVLASLPLTAAFLCKPTSVAPLLGIAAFLWWRGRKREAALWLVGGGLLAAGWVAALNGLTDGAYRINAFEALRGNRSWINLLVFPVAVLPLTLPHFAFAAWLIGVRVFRREDRAQRPDAFRDGVDFLIACLGAAWLVAVLTTLRDGSVEYYFCESLAFASILMALQWQRWLDSAAGRFKETPSGVAFDVSHRPILLVVSFAPALVAIVAILKLEPGPAQRLSDLWNLPHVVRADADRFARRLVLLNDLPRPILCDDDSLSLFADRPPLMMDIWLFSGLIDRGVFDDAAIRGDLESGRIGSVVLRRPVEQPKRYQTTWRLPPAWREVIMRRYRPKFADFDGLHVYVPRDDAAPQERHP